MNVIMIFRTLVSIFHCAFWDLEKTVLHEIRVSGTILWSPTSGSGNRVNDFCISGGPPVLQKLSLRKESE